MLSRDIGCSLVITTNQQREEAEAALEKVKAVMNYRRLAFHAIFCAVMACIGCYIGSYFLLPVIMMKTKPVAPLLGIALGLFFVGIPGVAGMGLGMAMDILKKGIKNLDETSIFDIIALSQYVALGLVLVFVHYVVLN